MKIYRVIYSSIYVEDAENLVMVKTFLDKDLALGYMKKEIEEIKKQVDDLEDYCVEENENSYERYLNGRSMEDSVAIWLEEDNTYDELVIQSQQKFQNEKEKEHEI